MKNKKKILGVLVCISVTLSSCGAKDVESKKDDEKSQKYITSTVQTEKQIEEKDITSTIQEEKQAEEKTEKITIDPPEGWEPVDTYDVSLHYAKETANFVIKTEKCDYDTLENISVKTKEVFSSTLENVQYIGSDEKIKVAGYDAIRFIFTCDMYPLNMKFEYVCFMKDDNGYAITFGNLSETFDLLSADYEQILNSIKFG
jgi:hypothetical protein